MKKVISVFLIIVTLINLITVTSYADETESTTELTEKFNELQTMLPDSAQYFNHLETHTATVTDVNGNSKEGESTLGSTYAGSTIFAVLSHVMGAIPQVVNQVLEFVLEGIGAENNLEHFTIYDTVMGNYELFNI